LKLKFKLISAFVLLSSITLLLVSFFSYINIRSRFIENINSELQSTVDRISNEFDGWLISKAKVVETTALILENTVEIDGVSKNYLDVYKDDPDIWDMYFGFEKTGNLLDGEDWIPPDDYDPRNRPWYQGAIEANDVTFSNPYTNSINGTYDVAISIPVKNAKGNLIGVLSGDISLAKLSKLVKNIHMENHGYGILIDKTGIVLAHPDEKIVASNLLENPQLKDVATEILANKGGIMTYNLNGEEKVIVYRSVPSTGWILGVTVVKNEIYKPLRAIQIKYIIINGIAIVVILLFALSFADYLTKPIKELTQTAEVISGGDLTATVKLSTKDEIGQLGRSFKSMVENLKKLIYYVADTSYILSASSQEMVASTQQSTSMADQLTQRIDSIAQGTSVTLLTVDKTSIIINEMVENIQQIATNVQTVNRAGEDAECASKNGEKALDKAVQTMTDAQKVVLDSVRATQILGDKSKKIGSIIQLITGIADQTNLLALNAAIEAARAGEQGRGFAVVADEVRKLAEESSNASSQIAQLITEIQKETDTTIYLMNKGAEVVEEGSLTVLETGKAFEKISKSIGHIVTVIDEVSTAIQQMAEGSEQIITSMNNISTAAKEGVTESQHAFSETQEQMSSIEEIVSGAQNLAQMAEELQGQVGQFKI